LGTGASGEKDLTGGYARDIVGASPGGWLAGKAAKNFNLTSTHARTHPILISDRIDTSMEVATMRLQLYCAVFAATLFSGTSAQALVTGWHVDHTPDLVGVPVQCIAADNAEHPIRSY
jgi:hypothetical protein